MIIKKVDLETVCGITSTLPDNQKPEIAFAGKSNDFPAGKKMTPLGVIFSCLIGTISRVL